MSKTDETYELLAKIASVTAEPITYGHLEALINVPGHFQSPVLAAVHKRCVRDEEPDLTSLVVKTGTREVSTGHAGSDPASERLACYKFHSQRASAWAATNQGVAT